MSKQNTRYKSVEPRKASMYGIQRKYMLNTSHTNYEEAYNNLIKSGIAPSSEKGQETLKRVRADHPPEHMKSLMNNPAHNYDGSIGPKHIYTVIDESMSMPKPQRSESAAHQDQHLNDANHNAQISKALQRKKANILSDTANMKSDHSKRVKGGIIDNVNKAIRDHKEQGNKSYILGSNIYGNVNRPSYKNYTAFSNNEKSSLPLLKKSSNTSFQSGTRTKFTPSIRPKPPSGKMTPTHNSPKKTQYDFVTTTKYDEDIAKVGARLEKIKRQIEK